MAEHINKLTPDRDLQCYFLTPSAVAAMSQASPSGFTVSGKWRQQLDWAVVEWCRDNVFEHPMLRNLPDGDLSGIQLTYQEERVGCIPFESNLAPVVDWDNLRIWASDDAGIEQLYHVPVWPSYAVPVEGEYSPASVTMNLIDSPGVGQRVGLAFLDYHHYWTVNAGDSLTDIARGIAQDFASNLDFLAVSSGNSVTVTWKAGPNYGTLAGANGNRIGIYGYSQTGQQCWEEATAQFGGGQFPKRYQVSVDFGKLKIQQGIPTDRVRKLRWTWAADLQNATFSQTEFSVAVTNWTVGGTGMSYSFAGPGSRRIENTDAAVSYNGSWQSEAGNYSGGSIEVTASTGDSLHLRYSETSAHDLYIGTRCLGSGASTLVKLDGQSLAPLNQSLAGEDVLVRIRLGHVDEGSHELILTHEGMQGSKLYFDFIEIVYSSKDLPECSAQAQLSLATDWDTYHSQSLPAERTAWLINKLGFGGRVNHYVGALWFCELVRSGTEYATASVTVPNGPYGPNLAAILAITPVAAVGQTQPTSTLIRHLILPDDTSATVAQALAALVNLDTNLLWASASNSQVVLVSRGMGKSGNGIAVQLSLTTGETVPPTAPTLLSGGVDGQAYDLEDSDSLNAALEAAADYWRADTASLQVLNRAARDWHKAYFEALKGFGLDVVAAFSTELLYADPSGEAGLAQRYPDGSPVVVNTPAVQTNFSPSSLAFWQKAYLTIAELQSDAGLIPYLQSGEVQWWYFPKQQWDARTNTNINVGMPFYDAYTLQQFEATYGQSLRTITDNNADPAQYPNECSFLPGLIGSFTGALRQNLKSSFPNCRYEVLYPTDTNDTPLNKVVNFPAQDWTSTNLTCFKTESFTFTANCNLDLALESIETSSSKGFANSARSHLVGINSATSPWMKEVSLAQCQGLESVVLFALDQFCLIGYQPPPYSTSSASQRRL